MEWQFMGDNEWVFGWKVRGIVREIKGEIYFDEDDPSRAGGWVWLIPGGKRGHAYNRSLAIRAVEEALGITGV